MQRGELASLKIFWVGEERSQPVMESDLPGRRHVRVREQKLPSCADWTSSKTVRSAEHDDIGRHVQIQNLRSEVIFCEGISTRELEKELARLQSSSEESVLRVCQQPQ